MAGSIAQNRTHRNSDEGASLFLVFAAIFLLVASPFLVIGMFRTGWVTDSQALTQFRQILGTEDVQIQVELPLRSNIREHNATFVLLVDGERTVYGRCDSGDFESLKCKLTERPEAP